MISIAQIRDMPLVAFVESFGDIAEHSPWFAEQAFSRGPFESRHDLLEGFTQALQSAGKPQQLALLCAHPDLAGKAKLTQHSAHEQEAAGLGALTGEEYQRFTTLNTGYRKKFGFPFIFAVRGATKHQILESFDARIGHSKDIEFETALREVMRIFRFRLEDRVQP